jgi:hypothetical protein
MIRVTLTLFFGSVLLLAQAIVQPPPQSPLQQTMTETATQLAARTSSLLPRRAIVSLEWQNLTSLPAAEWSNFRSLLQDELRKAGLETAGADTAATSPESRQRVSLSVTLSEDARGSLLVAEVFNGDNRQIAMLPWNPPASAQVKPRISLSRKLLWTQAEPILDILLVNSDSEMLILSPDKLVSYRLMGDQWTPAATASLLLPRPLPRDPRGRLEATAGGFAAFLPVATCNGAWNPELKLRCDSGIANWPGTSGTHWVADRNVLEGDAPAPGFEGWGSDWANIADPCGAGTVVLASSPNTEHDSVRAYLIRDGQPNPVSDPLPLPGPVTALWQAEAPRQATMVVQNLQTGQYEASRLGVACTQ